MRILICGDRNYDDLIIMEGFFVNFPGNTIIIHGNARGADRMAGKLAGMYGLDIEVYPAQWREYGKRAGILRNTQMLEEGKPDKVIWFHANIEQSKGTAHMISIAKKANIPVIEGHYRSE